LLNFKAHQNFAYKLVDPSKISIKKETSTSSKSSDLKSLKETQSSTFSTLAHPNLNILPNIDDKIEENSLEIYFKADRTKRGLSLFHLDVTSESGTQKQVLVKCDLCPHLARLEEGNTDTETLDMGNIHEHIVKSHLIIENR